MAKDKAVSDRVIESLQTKVSELKALNREADDLTQSWTSKYQMERQKTIDQKQEIELLI